MVTLEGVYCCVALIEMLSRYCDPDPRNPPILTLNAHVDLHIVMVCKNVGGLGRTCSFCREWYVWEQK